MKHVLRLSILAVGAIPFAIGAGYVVVMTGFAGGFDWAFEHMTELFKAEGE